MKQPFETAALKERLEAVLGFGIRSLARLGGASACNFKAVRESDGLPFLVKCSPQWSNSRFKYLVGHLSALRGTLAVRQIFRDREFGTFCGCDVICLAWSDGEPCPPDRLTEGEFDRFLDDYRLFSDQMQSAGPVWPLRPVRRWRDGALAKCRGLGGFVLRRLLEAVDEAHLDHDAALVRVVHGDFHQGNIHFSGGRMATVLDVEELHLGYRTDDLVRYVVCAAERLRWYEYGRLSRIVGRFGRAVARLPYSAGEWLTSVDGWFLYRVFMQTHKRERIGLWCALNLAFRSGLYAKLRRIVNNANGLGG